MVRGGGKPSSWFRLPHERVVKVFASVPYLNGGLFECLDTEDEANNNRKVYRDGFSRRADSRAFLPNRLFFGDAGLLPLLKRYDFTIDENHASDADIALDPELLGKVFENLLASYNPETGVSARKASGSFYTPREIVDYMVDQALRAALAPVADAKTLDTLFGNDADAVEALPDATKAALRERLESLKTIDPACGSGAFPMGLLNRMVDLLGLLGDPRPDYERKLRLITQAIYGVDIQPIAIQISKLRFFISLLCDQTVKPNEPNFGLDQLPNLETHLVIANSLIGFNDGENYLIPKHVEAWRDELKTLRATYVQAHTRAKKLELRARDHQLRTQIQDYFRSQHLAGVDRLAEWNPYDPTAPSPFFDSRWMFGIDKFDIVIGNPPYGLVNKRQNKGVSIVTDAPTYEYYSTSEYYKPAQGRGVNIYRLFILNGIRSLTKGGIFAEIFPCAFLGDTTAKTLREYVLSNYTILHCDAFPERDDENKRVFRGAKISVCILFITEKRAANATFTLGLHATRDLDKGTNRISLSYETIRLLSPEQQIIPLTTQSELDLLCHIYQQAKPLKTYAKCCTGELDMTFCKSLFVKEPCAGERMFRGAKIGCYVVRNRMSQGEELFVDMASLRKVKPKATTLFSKERIVFQGITGVNEQTRLKGTIISNAFCANSLNYLAIGHEDVLPKKVLLALFNSRLLNFCFKKFNTNSNVNGYEVESLPIVLPKGGDINRLSELAETCLRLRSNGEETDITKQLSEIDAVVYRLYGLTEEEVALVERSFAKDEKRAGAAKAEPAADEDEEEA